MKTNQERTYEILNGYLMSNNHINIESLAEEIIINAVNDRQLYEERMNNTRRKIRNIAISELLTYINICLEWYGYRGYYATSKQLIKYDREHGGDLEKVLDYIVDNIQAERAEY